VTVDAEIRDWRGQLSSRPVAIRALAAAFRRGEKLSEPELRVLRDYAAENGNALLLQRIREELRTA
jgi:hypothetical protein